MLIRSIGVDPWYQQSASHRAYPRDQEYLPYSRVVPSLRSESIELLKSEAAVEITIEEANRLTGRTVADDKRAFLVRGLQTDTMDVRYSPSTRLVTVINMAGTCFDLGPQARERVPIVILLEEPPLSVYLAESYDCL